VSDLAVRRVMGWGETATLKVFDNTGTLVTTLDASSQAWTSDSSTYDIGVLSAGEKIYFAVDGNENYVGDGIEVAWRVDASVDETTPPEDEGPVVWDSWDLSLSESGG